MKNILILILTMAAFQNSYAQLSISELKAKAIEYAPQFRFYYKNRQWPLSNDKEQYFPSSVEWYMDRVKLFHDTDENHDSSRDRLLASVGELNSSVDLPRGFYSQFDYMLHGFNTGVSEGNRDDGPGHWTTYVHIRKSFNAGHPFYSNDYDIQYWLFYPYSSVRNNTGVGEHEGDWEFVTIKVDGITGDIKKVYYGAHGSEGRWRPYQALQWSPEGSLAVYSSQFGHANYHYAANYITRPDISETEALLGGTDDKTSAEGYTNGYADYYFNSKNRVEFISTEVNSFSDGRLYDSETRKDWMRFEGFWGRTNQSETFGGTMSPRGPVFQEHNKWNGYYYDSKLYTEPVNEIKYFQYSTAEIYNGFGSEYAADGRVHVDLGDTWADYVLKETVGPVSMRIQNAKQGVVIKVLSTVSPTQYMSILIKKDIIDNNILIDHPLTEVDNEFIKVTNHGNFYPFFDTSQIGNVVYEYPRYMDITNDVEYGTDYHWAENELTANNKVRNGAQIKYYSANSIVLNSAFEAELGAIVDIDIKLRHEVLQDFPSRGTSIHEQNERSKSNNSNGRFVDSLVDTDEVKALPLDEKEIYENQILVYPNPLTNGILNMKFNASVDDSYVTTIYDSKGKSVYVKNINIKENGNATVPLDISHLKHGIYILHVLSNKISITKKISVTIP